ncbi:MAG: glycine cleavage system protein H [Bryobacteraceae bacterium]|nr:glycine cleavage system protein H [Bryobacteraceae bacterium]
MTVIFVILTFAVFLTVDYILHRKNQPAVSPLDAEGLATHGAEEIIDGFHFPSKLRYHMGHTWLNRERKNVHRVGADEFAAILAGPVDRIELPKPGTWVRQGQRAVALYRGEEKIELVSPIEGEVVDVNAELMSKPEVLRNDPYGEGWLMTVFAPDEEAPSHNLLPQGLLRTWIRDAAEGFFGMQQRMGLASAADGGRPLKNATENLPVEVWKEAARRFLLN